MRGREPADHWNHVCTTTLLLTVHVASSFEYLFFDFLTMMDYNQELRDKLTLSPTYCLLFFKGNWK